MNYSKIVVNSTCGLGVINRFCSTFQSETSLNSFINNVEITGLINMSADYSSWFGGFFSHSQEQFKIINCTNSLNISLNFRENQELNGYVPGVAGFIVLTHNQTYLLNCTFAGTYDSQQTDLHGTPVRLRNFGGFIIYVKSNTTIENCTYSGKVKSQSENHFECGAGAAVAIVFRSDWDYKNNSYIIKLTLNNFVTTVDAYLHDYHYHQVINPLISSIMSGWESFGFINYPQLNLTNIILQKFGGDPNHEGYIGDQLTIFDQNNNILINKTGTQALLVMRWPTWETGISFRNITLAGGNQSN